MSAYAGHSLLQLTLKWLFSRPQAKETPDRYTYLTFDLVLCRIREAVELEIEDSIATQYSISQPRHASSVNPTRLHHAAKYCVTSCRLGT